jgi:hypothetical protein
MRSISVRDCAPLLTARSTPSCLISPVSFKTSVVAAATLALRGLTTAGLFCGAATCAEEFGAPPGHMPAVNTNATTRTTVARGQTHLFLFDISNLSLL